MLYFIMDSGKQHFCMVTNNFSLTKLSLVFKHVIFTSFLVEFLHVRTSGCIVPLLFLNYKS